MDDKLQKQLIRQLKILNIWMSVFGVMFLVAATIIGFLLWQVVVFAQQTGDKIDSFQQSTTNRLDVKAQVCDGTDSFSEFVRRNTNACN